MLVTSLTHYRALRYANEIKTCAEKNRRVANLVYRTRSKYPNLYDTLDVDTLDTKSSRARHCEAHCRVLPPGEWQI